jgi:hypothetical protein
MIIVALLYGFGCVRNINCAFDNSEPKQINTKVADKQVEHGKSTTWTLKLMSWDDNPSTKNIEVSQSVYDQYQVGNNIDIYIKPGLLAIPWYYINN